MKIRRVVQIGVFLGLVLFTQDAKSASRAKLLDTLAPTVHRYLKSSGSYVQGDLITKSQVEELQEYLRKTQGLSTATHPKWRQRMLPDNAPLVRIFHAGGQDMLREAATQLGGYMDLDRLSRSGKGRDLLHLAIEQKSVEGVVSLLLKERAERAVKEAIAEKKTVVSSLNGRIYTAEEFLISVKAALLSEVASEGQEKSGAKSASKR